MECGKVCDLCYTGNSSQDKENAEFTDLWYIEVNHEKWYWMLDVLKWITKNDIGFMIYEVNHVKWYWIYDIWSESRKIILDVWYMKWITKNYIGCMIYEVNHEKWYWMYDIWSESRKMILEIYKLRVEGVYDWKLLCGIYVSYQYKYSYCPLL